MVSLGNRLTSCACLSLQANIGQMDTAKDKWKMIMGNLALIQVPYTLQVFAHYFCCNGSSRVVEVRSLKMPCVCMFLARTVPIYFYNCVMKLRKGILLKLFCLDASPTKFNSPVTEQTRVRSSCLKLVWPVLGPRLWTVDRGRLFEKSRSSPSSVIITLFHSVSFSSKSLKLPVKIKCSTLEANSTIDRRMQPEHIVCHLCRHKQI